MRLPPSNSHSQPQPLSRRTCGSTTIAKFFENAPIELELIATAAKKPVVRTIVFSNPFLSSQEDKN